MYECPRCGAGIRPGDKQCGRCGEILDKCEREEGVSVPSSVTLNSVFSDKRTSVRMGSSSSYCSLSEMRERLERKERALAERERELKDREAEVLSALEEIEHDTAAMEDAISRYEEDRAQLHRREGLMKEREREMDAMVEEISQKEERVAEVLNSLKERGYDLNELESLIREKDRCQRALDEERARLEEEYSSRIAEARKSVPEMPGTPRMEEFPELDIASFLEDISSELGSQIGAGAEGAGKVRVVPTGNPRLDDILGGGVPRDHVLLVSGQPGTMKSTLAYYLIQRAAGSGLRSMYFSLEQDRESLLRQMDRVGLGREEDVIVVDMVDLRKSMEHHEGDWREILQRYVSNVHSERRLDMFVLDSMEAFKALTEFRMERQELKEYFDWLRELGMTVLLIGEAPIQRDLAEDNGELYLSDGVIELMMKELDNNQVQRRMRVLKMRGLNNDTRYYTFRFDDGGLEVSTPLTRSGPGMFR